MAKIYTRTGDGGETSLLGGRRVPKDHGRVDAYGAVDEGNAAIGLAIAHETDPEIAAVLQEVQRQLLTLGGLLASPGPGKVDGVPEAMGEEAIRRVEAWIDAAEDELSPLSNFILPGGSPAAACLHLARTIIRRAERRTVALVRSEGVDGSAVRYLNRLSDLLFVLARLSNRRSGERDIVWRRE